ncbi:hypothetical protein DACRYDRAFT_116950 [Dacryopinax primogenitus]|uniref:Lanthionine synthetase C family protein n=1 Tax=Dacryopinax primogenitus (strain DJM 731) TaxID=1858805 RepID=M5G5R9_DACPD|nr:uncharacterized protein DACRYDRAFT_116950 [Dacryopinax primogenitus]EJU01142.1 hypothetical protein DACRYDRAFT_116950 [Dacryopinax primogenitus]
MATDPSFYLQNNLNPSYDADIIEKTRTTLGAAIAFSVDEIEKHLDSPDEPTIPRIYSSQVGEAVGLLRLYAQAGRLGLPDVLKDRLPALIKKFIGPCFTDKNPEFFEASSKNPDVRRKVLNFGKCGMMTSLPGPAFLEISRQLLIPETADDDDDMYEIALGVLQNGFAACFEASNEQDLQGDMVELMWSTAGFLYGVIGMRAMLDGMQTTDPGKIAKAKDSRLLDIVSNESIGRLVTEIIHTGVHGSGRFREQFGHAPPVMWRDFRRSYALGGIHGVAGVLLILLQVPNAIIYPYLNGHILPTLDWLLAQQRNGNMPRTYPTNAPQAGGPAWQCQFCHGAIGPALMLTAYKHLLPFPTEGYTPRSIVAKRLNRDKCLEDCLDFIWKEGLLRKGISVCHGITGNAVPFLIQAAYDLKEGKTESLSLGRALALLRYASGLPPINMPQSEQSLTLPDGQPIFGPLEHPTYLFQGIAGAMCVWADALVLLNNQLEGAENVTTGIVGFPLAGGLGIRLPL